MAFYSDDDEQNQAAQGQASAVSKPGSGLVGGGAAASGAAGAAPAEAAKASTPGNSASPFVGIKEYLGANKQQSGKLGGQVGGFVGGRIDKAGEALKGAEQNFGQAVDQATVKLDNDLVSQIKADPTKVAADKAKLQQAKAMQQGYAGPTDFKTHQSYQAADPLIKKAEGSVENLKKAQGQKQLLTEQQLETRGGKLNRGAATLDQALLQASPEAREALKPTQEKGAALKGNIDQTLQNAMAKITGAQGQTAATNKAITDLYNQQFADHQAALNQRAAQANREVNDYNTALKQRVYNGEVTDQDLAYLGVNRADFDALRGDFAQYGPETAYGNRGMDELTRYLMYQTPGATAANVAGQDDYARAQALRELAGFGPDYLQNASQANTFNRDAVDFDLAAARNFINPKVAEAKRIAEAQRKVASGEVDASQVGMIDPQTGLIIGGAFAGLPGAIIGAGSTKQLNQAGGAISGAAKSIGISDERQKKDIKHFDAKKFLDAVSQGRK